MEKFGLEEHIGKPVSLIPDPYGTHDSYGMHMSSILLDGLDKVGIEYEFRRAKDTYNQGLLKDQIHTILENSTRIGDKISELVGQKNIKNIYHIFQFVKNAIDFTQQKLQNTLQIKKLSNTIVTIQK